MSVTIKTGYPVYGAQFYDNNTAVITGGGGEGNNGIPNKLAVLSIDLNRADEKIKIVNELEIEGKNDSPTGLAIGGDTILIGENQGAESVKAGENKHLRKFKLNEDLSVSFDKSVDIEQSKDSNEYQKITKISANGKTAAIVSSKTPSVLRIIDPKTLEVKESVELPEGEEINDVAISKDGSKIAYATNTKLTVIQDGELPTLSHSKFAKNYLLSKVLFVDNENLLVGVNLKNGAGVLLLHSAIAKDEEGLDILKTKKARVITNNFKKITALELSKDSEQFIAVAGNDNSIVISDFKDFKPYRTLKKIHSFAITDLSFSPNGKYLLSTSAANTVNVYKIPSSIRFSLKPYITALIVLLVSIFLYDYKQKVTDDQWEEFYSTVAYLYGEEYIPRSIREADLYSASAAASTTVDTGIIEQEPSDYETIETTTTTTQTETVEVTYTTDIQYETETIIKEGDIVDIKVRSLSEEAEEVKEAEAAAAEPETEENDVHVDVPVARFVENVEDI